MEGNENIENASAFSGPSSQGALKNCVRVCVQACVRVQACVCAYRHVCVQACVTQAAIVRQKGSLTILKV